MVAKMKEFRRYAIVFAFVLAAVAAPPNVSTQLALAIPLWLAYECAILLVGWLVENDS